MYKDGVTQQIIIGLTGYSGAGKDTAALPLIDMLGFKRLAFADKVKQLLYIINPLVLVRTSKPARDDKGMSIIGKVKEELSVTNVQFLVNQLGWDGAKEIPEVRRMLQRLATEGARQLFGQNIWCDALEPELDLHNLVIITDVRFPNEAAMILKRGGHLVHIDRQGQEPLNAHSSETSVDDVKALCAFAVANDGTREDLHACMLNIIRVICDAHYPKHKLNEKVRFLLKK